MSHNVEHKPNAKKENKNVPKKFKQTDVGIIPEDWEVKRLGDTST